jgi:uncharacterized protein (TIGR00297 family)
MKILDKEGTVAAIVIGVVIVLSGGWNYLLFMFLFLFLGILVTKYEEEIKRSLGLYEHERGIENVLSNGLGPMIFVLFSGFTGPGPFIASVAAITSDTFGSELGVLGKKQPIFLGDFKPARPGTSGAISLMGTIASAVGAMVIAFASMLLFDITPNQAFLIGAAGFLGSVADTLFGILEERGIGSKGTTNFICSIVGGLVGLLFLSL